MNKRLYRTKQGRMVGGVAAGLAEYFDVDPVIVRAIFIITSIGWGGGILAYIILWIIVPEKPVRFAEKENDPESDEEEPFYEEETVYEDKKNEDFDYHDVINKNRKQKPNSDNNSKTLFGLLLILLGAIFLLNNVIPHFDMDYLWPLALVGFGLYILYKTTKDKKRGGSHETE